MFLVPTAETSTPTDRNARALDMECVIKCYIEAAKAYLVPILMPIMIRDTCITVL